jgi:hypothetical protein
MGRSFNWSRISSRDRAAAHVPRPTGYAAYEAASEHNRSLRSPPLTRRHTPCEAQELLQEGQLRAFCHSKSN